MRVFGDPNFEGLGRQRKSVEMGRKGPIDNCKYLGAMLGCFISYKLIWRKLELNIKFNS